MNTIDLTGRCAIITGGAQCIGLAIANRLLTSGASVSLWDADQQFLRAAVNELQAQGKDKAHSCFLDVTDAAAVAHAVSATAQALGRIDILVTSAGHHGTKRERLGLSPPRSLASRN